MIDLVEAKCGDEVEVKFIGTLSENEEDDAIPVAGIGIEYSEDGTVSHVLICDDLTLDEFPDQDDVVSV
jgi:hypothetical protein